MVGTALIVRPTDAVAVFEIDALSADAARLAAASKADATRKAYTSDWADFSDWCASRHLDPMPAAGHTLALYLTHLSNCGKAVSTITRRASAITSIHRAADQPNPCDTSFARDVLSGIRNTRGTATRKKQALTVDLVSKVIRRIKPNDPRAARDRVLILLGFGSALRRSELVGLRVEHLAFSRKGLVVQLPKSKSDQKGEGRRIAIPDGKLKIPAAVKSWLATAGITEGFVFPIHDRGQTNQNGHLSAKQYAEIIKKRCEAAGLDPVEFSGHSTRRGFATTAGDEHADLRRTADHMRHVKLETTMGYMEEGEMFRDHAGAAFL